MERFRLFIIIGIAAIIAIITLLIARPLSMLAVKQQVASLDAQITEATDKLNKAKSAVDNDNGTLKQLQTTERQDTQTLSNVQKFNRNTGEIDTYGAVCNDRESIMNLQETIISEYKTYYEAQASLSALQTQKDAAQSGETIIFFFSLISVGLFSLFIGVIAVHSYRIFSSPETKPARGKSMRTTFYDMIAILSTAVICYLLYLKLPIGEAIGLVFHRS